LIIDDKAEFKLGDKFTANIIRDAGSFFGVCAVNPAALGQ
jgi:hypothetical protein